MTHPVSQSGGRHRRPRLLLLLLVAGLLAAGLASGLGSALAADPSASPAGDKVVLHVGWTNDPDNLNPFIGAETSSYEIWLLNYDFLTGYSLDLQPTPDLATSWETSAGRQDLDLPPARGREVAGRRAVHRRRRGVHLQLHRRQPDGRATRASPRSSRRPWPIDDLTVEIRCSKPKANMITTWIPILPEHVWSKVEPQGGRRLVSEQAAHRRHRALPDGRGQEGRLRAHGRQPHVLGREADHRRDPLRHLPEPRHDDPGPARAGRSTPPGASRRRSSPRSRAPRASTPISYNLLTWDYLAMNCYEGHEPRQPGAQGRGLPPGAQLGASTGRRSSTSRGPAAAQPGTTIMTPDSWVDPDYHWQPPADAAVHLRPGQGEAAARRRRLQGRRRRRHPRGQERQAHQAAPVGARRVAGEPEDRQPAHRLVS